MRIIKRLLPVVLAVSIAGLVMGPLGEASAATKLPHDKVSRLSGSATKDQARFLPSLEFENGCQPYAAVQDDGSFSGGLKATGSESGACRGNGTGQAIVRTRCEAGICAHMYSLYFPKDMAVARGVAVSRLGHRHEWENIVVWAKDGAVAAVAFSQHSGYQIRKPEEVTFSGDSVCAKYGRGDVGTHVMSPGGCGARMPALVSFESITAEARDTLNNPRTFGGIDFAAREDMFSSKLGKARPSWL